MKQTIAIIGAGNGGQAFAGYLALKGHEVRLFDVMEDTIAALSKKGGVEVEGHSDVTGFGRVALCSTDIGRVMEGADILLVVLPSTFHDSIAEKMAPYLKDGQLVLLNPAAPLGCMAFANTLENNSCSANILLGSTNTLLFAVRIIENGRVFMSGQKTGVSGAAYPASGNEAMRARMQQVIPEIHFEHDIIYNGLENMNALVHPGPVMLNTGRIEGGVSFEYYSDMTPSICRLIDAMDAERLALGQACGFDMPDFVTAFKALYPGAVGDSTYEILTSNPGYKGIKGPTTMDNRYLREDIPYSLMAFQSLGRITGVPTPCTDAIITLARQLLPDLASGRTMENLGMEGLPSEAFLARCRG